MKYLIIAPSWIGDLVMSQSLFITLKKQLPKLELHVMAPIWCFPILSRMPEVDRTIEMPIGHGSFALGARWKIGRTLQSEHYDQAIVLPNSLKSAFIPLFAGIKKRSGWKGESRYGLLNDLRNNKQNFPRMVERYVALAFPKPQMKSSRNIPEISFPKLYTDEMLQKSALTLYDLNTIKPILGLCPGAEFGPAKRWPEKYYAEIAKRWINQNNGQIWIFGSTKDIETAEQIKNCLPVNLQTNCNILAGKTTLTEAIDLLASCNTVVSNDSGLMHIAAAVKTPLVAIYGSTSPTYTPPLSDTVQIVNTDIECRPCFKRECPLNHLNCLNQLNPNQVWHAIQQLPFQPRTIT